MLRTLQCKTFQIRWDWTCFALFFGMLQTKAIKLYWWDHPRIVLDLTDSSPIIIGKTYAGWRWR